MIWMLLVAAIGTFDFTPSSPWGFPEAGRGPSTLQDTLFDSLNMRFVGNWPFGPSYAVAVDSTRDIVFLGSGGGVYVLDVSIPSDPQEISEKLHTRGIVMDLFYDSPNQNLYLADDDVTLEIWDVEDPANPTKLGWWDNAPPMVFDYLVSREVTVLDSFAYVIDWSVAYGVDDGLHIINVSDPLFPHRVGFLGLPTALGFAISGSYAYVVCGDHGLEVVDISNPSNPQWECRGPDGVYESIAISDSHAYVGGALNSGEEGFVVLDISNHLNVHAVGCCSTVFGVEAVAISDSCAYAATHDSSLYVIDISDASNPQVIAHYDTPGLGEDIAIMGLHTYVAEAASGREEEPGLRIINVSIPATPHEVSHWDVPGVAETIVLREPYAYVGTRDGLWVLDISNRANPQELGHCQVCGYHRSMAVSDSYAYVAASEEGLRIVDITDPAMPQEISHCLTPGFAQSVAVSEPYVYVALRSSGFCVVDVSDPSSPQEVAVYDSWKAWDVAVSGTYAYIAGDSGLSAIDISSPAAPVHVGSCGDIPWLSDVAVSDSYAYCLELIDGGLHVFDISNPCSCRWVGVWRGAGSLLDIAVSNERVTIASNSVVGGECKFCCPWLIDVSDLDDFQTAGYYRAPSFCAGVAAASSYVYAVGGGAGLQIYEFCGTGVQENPHRGFQSARLEIRPSVAVGLVAIYYELPVAGKVSVGIYDIAGRTARSPEGVFQKKGKHSVSIDTGEFPAGIYFVRMTIDSEWTLTEKLTIIK